MKHPTLVVTAMLTLTSCLGTSIRDKIAGAVTVPTKWQHRASSGKPLDTAALTTWWKRFYDPALNDVITGALTSNTDVRTALSRIAEYRARRGVERAGLFPSLDISSSGQGSRSKDRSTKLTTTSESYQAALSPSWEVDLFGKQQLNVKAASADLAQVNDNYYGAQVSLAAEVATAYVTLRSAEVQLAVVQNSLGTRRETVRLTQWSEEAGTGTALDTQQSISTLEQARATIPTLQLSIAQSRNQLTLLSGRAPSSLDSVLSKQRDVPTMPTGLAIGIPAETLRQRPDVRAAERGVEAAFARTKSAQRERLPTLNLSGSLGIEALKAGRLFSPQSIAGSVLGSLAAPIFDAGRIRNNITIQSEREKQALIAYEATVLTALTEVENALIAVQRYSERLAILSLAVNAARKAVTLSGMQFKAGEIDLFVSLDDQRTLLSLEQQEVITSADRATACIQLYKSLGGGWSPH
jgi:NodT family efflux transporter outer membrane factor (OMF) lipoprotein